MSLPNNAGTIEITISFHIHSDISPPQKLVLPQKSNVRNALEVITERTGTQFFSSDGALEPHFIVLIEGAQIEILQGLDTLLTANTTLAVLSAIHGGFDGI